MDFENFIEQLDEGMFSLLLLGGTVFGAALVHWATEFYRKTSLRIGADSSDCCLTGHVVATRLLAACGLAAVPVRCGTRLNCYHPWRREIRLTPEIYNSPSLVALAVAAHEVGHAQQFAARIFICRLRQVILPICIILLSVGLLLLLLGFAHVIELPPGSISIGTMVVCLVIVALQLPVNLPLERDASRRALELVKQANLIAEGEQTGFCQLLRAAWLTHAAMEAQRWIMVAAVLVFTAFVPSYFGLEPIDSVHVALDQNPAVSPTTGGGESLMGELLLSPIGQFCIWGSPMILALVLLTRMQKSKRTFKSAREQAVQRNNVATDLDQQGNPVESIREYTEALRLDPTLLAASYNRGRVHLSLGNLDEAFTDFETTLRRAPRFVDAILGRGNVRLMRGDLDAAMADFDEAVRLAPESATALVCRGNVWNTREDYHRAISDYTAAIERDAAYGDAYRDRGLAWYFSGEHRRALTDLDQAIVLNAQDALAFNNRGCTFWKIGEYEKSRVNLREAIRLAPSFPNAYKHIAWLEASCPEAKFRDGEQAVRHAIRALELTNWKKCDWFETLAAAHAEAGDYAQAIAWQRRCIEESSPHERSKMETRLELFRTQQPYRDFLVAESVSGLPPVAVAGNPSSNAVSILTAPIASPEMSPLPLASR